MDLLHPGKFARDVIIQDYLQPLCFIGDCLHITCHLRRGEQEMNIVRVISKAIEAIIARQLQIFFIRARCLDIGGH